jgi:hypothetical protein
MYWYEDKSYKEKTEVKNIIGLSPLKWPNEGMLVKTVTIFSFLTEISIYNFKSRGQGTRIEAMSPCGELYRNLTFLFAQSVKICGYEIEWQQGAPEVRFANIMNSRSRTLHRRVPSCRA